MQKYFWDAKLIHEGVDGVFVELIFKSFKDFEYKETNLFFNYQ